jgi:hypothetical protein
MDAVRENSPGRKYYSNLGFFLRTFSRPDGADAAEVSAYIRLIESDKDLRPDQKKGIVETLRASMY